MKFYLKSDLKSGYCGHTQDLYDHLQIPFFHGKNIKTAKMFSLRLARLALKRMYQAQRFYKKETIKTARIYYKG